MSQNIISLFGAAFVPPKKGSEQPKETQVANAIADAGLTIPKDLVFDGQLHRFSSGDKRDNNGWYILFDGNIPSGSFGCWKSGVSHNFRMDIGRELSVAESMAHSRRMAETKVIRDRELLEKRETAADTAKSIWDSSIPAAFDHPYLMKKGIAPHEARIAGDGRLVIPVYFDSELVSIQYIATDGSKLFLKGGQTKGGMWSIGDISYGVIYIAEGFATAASIHEATGTGVFIAFSASNLTNVAKSVREMVGITSAITIVGDNDESGTGEREGRKAAEASGAKFVLSPVGDANDYMQQGGDLVALLNPIIMADDHYLIAADEFCQSPAPIKWMVKNWIQRDALVMVHGPSGGGKTFVVLDWMMKIASDHDEWCGARVSNGNVIYLAGEGHHGLRSRIAAWKRHHNNNGLRMWVSRSGCDLNTAAGYTMARDAIISLNKPPSVIVVDTLHRFMYGDENSAQDAKTMLDACSGLMQEFGCTVLLVHHTGVNEESQHRARGSSAWRGALDIEISVIPGTEDKPIEIVQRKSKDAEMAKSIHMTIQTVPLDWIDEDGAQVLSAIVVQADAPVVVEKDPPGLRLARARFEEAILQACEIRDGKSCVSDRIWNSVYEKDENGKISGGGKKMKCLDKKIIMETGHVTESDGIYLYDNASIAMIINSKLKSR